MKTQYWLAEVDVHGNPKLIDGAHSDRAGADRAKFLFDSLGLTKDRRLMVAKVELSEASPSSDGVNMAAVAQLNSMGLKP